MNTELFTALDLLEKEKGVPRDYMIEKLEAALTNAYKKEHGGATNVRVVLNPEKKDIKVYQQKTVVETVEDSETQISLEDAKAISKRHKLDGVVEFEVKTDKFSRLAAQAGKQVIIQAIREAERMNMTRAYENKKEEIITATVYKVDESDGSVVVDTGTSRAVLPKTEQIPGEHFEVGDRVKVFVSEVHSAETRGPVVSLSRVHPGLVSCLFRLQIPEIQDGTVEIKSVARDAGSRTKIAVCSHEADVDPVGACIGNHGMRIGAILEELGGNEKIDVIRYMEDTAAYVKEALSPATVLSVEFDGERCCRVTVAPDQLSLAIGKEGQNAKLAAKLTGCKIDIKA